MEYAASGKSGSFKEISEETGIPMGESTGKLPAILSYAEGMGLIETDSTSVKQPVLTDFGRAVYQEDRFLGEEITQWLVHFNLCRRDIGAIAWNKVFAQGMLGASFTKTQLEDYLVGVFGGKNRTGPMLVTYYEDAALLRAGILKIDGETICRSKVPLISSFSTAYSAYMLSLIEVFFPSETQVTVTDFNEVTQWFNICFWNESEIEIALTMIGETGNISIDRQMRPWIIEKRRSSVELWPTIWDYLA